MPRLRLADEPAAAIAALAEVEREARQAAPADLVDHARDAHVVVDERPPSTRRLGTAKSETPLMPARRAVDARERQVHDVLGEIVIAAGDEDLRARRCR